MHKPILVLTLIGLLSWGSAQASEPATKGVAASEQSQEVKRFKRGGWCSGFPGEQVNCDHIGRVKIHEIYSQGWRVVAAYQANQARHVIYIEEQ